MPHPQTFTGSKVIAFPPLGTRENRVSRNDDTERGTILLFTGVRYERFDEDVVELGAETSHGDRRDEIWA